MQARRRFVPILVASLALFPLAASSEPEASASCPAEGLTSLRLLADVPDCSETPQECASSCNETALGDCLAAGYAFEARDDLKAAHALYKRACLLGSANACTNYGAAIWSGGTTEHSLPCAHSLFRRACSAGEHFGCGMMARIGYEEAKSESEFAALRRELESACSGVGGFSCRVLAKYLETKKLGPFEPDEIPRLLAQACEQGDPDACGNPRSAQDTFKK